MGLFGLTLKKVENFGDNIWHDLTGGNSGGTPSGGGGGGGLTPYNPASYSSGGPLAPSPNGQQRMAPQQQGHVPGAPIPNPSFLRPPQQQQGPGFTPKGMHRDQNGNLVPDTQMPQISGPTTGPDPIGSFLKAHIATPVVNLTHEVGASTVGQAVRLGTAELTHNDQAISDAKQGFQQAVHNLAPPQPYVDAQGNPTSKGGSGTKTNPAYSQYLVTMASGGEGEGLGPLSVSARSAKAAGAVDAAKPSAKLKPVTSDTTVSAPKTPKTTAAFQRLNDLYDGETLSADDAHSLIGKSIGVSRNFSRAGNDLQSAMQDELTPTERTAVRDVLEGQPPKLAKGDDMEKVQTVAQMSKDLAAKGATALGKSDEGFKEVGQYATRIPKSSKGTKPSASLVQRGFSDIKSLLNIEHSGFGKSRSIGKFVSDDGDVKYGNPDEIGLKKNKNEDFVDGSGKVYNPQATSTAELNKNGFDYENDYAKNLNRYHTSVGRVKTGMAAKEELLNNPEKYGLVKAKGTAGTPAPKGYEYIRQVPELDGYVAPKNVAKDIDTSLGHPRNVGNGERAWQGINNGVIQQIVYNPGFHARNLNQMAGMAAGKAKASPFGGLILKKGLADVFSMSKEDTAALDEHMIGVHRETYSTDRPTVLSNALDKAHIPHVNKLSSAAMAHTDWNIRRALFHVVTTGKRALNDDQAAALVNEFMGDRANMGPLARNVGLFWHYLKTRTNIVKNTAMHPIEYRGAIMTGAVQTAILYAEVKAFQEWTGNKHASIGHPGVFGLANDANNLRHGRTAAVVAGKVNPLVLAALNQLYGQDLYTGDKLSTGKARLQNAEQSLSAPTQTTSKVTDGKQTATQAAVQALTGISTPHTRGSPAIPNENNPLAPSFNAKSSKPAADEGSIHDPTGIDQATLYYKAKDAGLQAVNGNPEATDLFNAYIDSEATPGGDKMKKSPAETMGVAEALSGSPAALSAMQKFQRANPTHDPMWDLSQKDLSTFLKTQGSSSSSGVKAAHEIIDTGFNNGEGLKGFLKRRDAYYSNNNFGPGTAQDNPETPKYPTFSGQQLLDYNLYKAQFQNADSKTKSAWLQAHPDVVEAISSLGQYYNDLNFAQTGLRTKDSSTLTPELQRAYTEYNALPKGNGKYGGSPDRSAWIKSHQDIWNAITTALGQGDLVGLAEQGAVNQYKGVEWTPQFLKDAYNAGHYDIAPVTNADGSKGFAFNPPAASEANRSASSFTPYARGASAKQEAAYQRLSASFTKYRAQVKLASQSRDAEHASKADKNLIKGVQYNAKLHGPKRMSIHMSGEKKVSPAKVKGATLAPRKVTKVIPKTQTALKSRNHAKLKA